MNAVNIFQPLVLLHDPTSQLMIGRVKKITVSHKLNGKSTTTYLISLDDGSKASYIAPIDFNPKRKNNTFEVLGYL